MESSNGKQHRFSLLAKIVLVIVAIVSLTQVMIFAKDIPFSVFSARGLGRLTGSLLPTILMNIAIAFVLGIIPYFKYRKTLKNTKIITFGIPYIIISLLLLNTLITLRREAGL